MSVTQETSTYSTLAAHDVLKQLQTDETGLTESEAKNRQQKYGLNVLQSNRINAFTLFLRQLTDNPLLLILAVCTFIAFLLGDRTSSFYIFGVIIVSIILGFWNEYSAEKTVQELMKKITPNALVLRNGEKEEVPVTHLTIGDIVLLSQGSIIPADLRLIETKALEVNESALTGEAKSVFKQTEVVSAAHPLPSQMKNTGFMGTSVESGSGKGVVIQIGKNTEFGKIAKSATFIKPTTEFQRGLAKLGNLIIKVVIIFTIVIFIINALIRNDILNSVLFALAIAVGITPELLPVIVTVSLSHGAGKLAKKHVVVKKLLSLESLGNIDILCTDKTGTLTEGKINVTNYIDNEGRKDIRVLIASLLCNNALVHKKVTGNAIDVALWEHALEQKLYLDPGITKLYEEVFDYNRKINFSVIKQKEIHLYAKGAPESIIPLCKNIKHKQALTEKMDSLRNEGLRIIALAKKTVHEKNTYTWHDVDNLEYIGYITFLDIPKKSAQEALLQLKNLNVMIKIITGDNEIVTKKICEEVGMDVRRVVTGPQLEKLSGQELLHIVSTVDIFARVLPLQKLKIIKALQDSGHTVGYLGDGINDLPALHNADVGISVNTAVDVAKESASVVLLRKGIDVISDGIREGRRTFNNTIKYILMSISSSFGNMFSAAGASFFLPFLPMTPVQILLNNALYDMAQLSIPSDHVDHESLVKPRHWNIEFIKNYMLFFGPLSSIFDYLTFSILLIVFHPSASLFQTGWFIESLATQILIVFVIRTAKTPFFKSKPSKWLIFASLGTVLLGIVLPFTPLAKYLGFVAPPPIYFVFLLIVIVSYLILVEKMKNEFLKKYNL